MAIEVNLFRANSKWLEIIVKLSKLRISVTTYYLREKLYHEYKFVNPSVLEKTSRLFVSQKCHVLLYKNELKCKSYIVKLH